MPFVALGVSMNIVDATIVNVAVPVDESGQASGTQSTARQVGSVRGVALLGTILLSLIVSKSTSAIVHAASSAAVDAARSVSFAAAGFIYLRLVATLLQPPSTDAHQDDPPAHTR